MKPPLVYIKIRRADDFGSGFFMAKRGKKPHKGLDLIVIPGENVYAPISGKVTKIGYAYADDLSYRYVQIANSKYRVRLFYVDACTEVGDFVTAGDNVGTAQDIAKRYTTAKKTMKNHVHIEVYINGQLTDPQNYFAETSLKCDCNKIEPPTYKIAFCKTCGKPK